MNVIPPKNKNNIQEPPGWCGLTAAIRAVRYLLGGRYAHFRTQPIHRYRTEVLRLSSGRDMVAAAKDLKNAAAAGIR